MGGNPTQLLSVLVLVCALAVWGWCLVHFASTDEREMCTFARSVWVVVIVLGSVVGGALWLAVGRPRRPSS